MLFKHISILQQTMSSLMQRTRQKFPRSDFAVDTSLLTSPSWYNFWGGEVSLKEADPDNMQCRSINFQKTRIHQTNSAAYDQQ